MSSSDRLVRRLTERHRYALKMLDSWSADALRRSWNADLADFGVDLRMEAFTERQCWPKPSPQLVTDLRAEVERLRAALRSADYGS